jgi:hypothetical protein
MQRTQSTFFSGDLWLKLVYYDSGAWVIAAGATTLTKVTVTHNNQRVPGTINLTLVAPNGARSKGTAYLTGGTVYYDGTVCDLYFSAELP